MQRIIDNLKTLGLAFADPQTMQPRTTRGMEETDRTEISKALASFPHKDKFIREGYTQMVRDVAFAAVEQTMTAFTERVATAPMTNRERNVAALLALLALENHLSAVREGLLLNVATLSALDGVLDLDGTESAEQLNKMVDDLIGE